MSLQSLLGKYQNKNSSNSNKRPRNDTEKSEKSSTNGNSKTKSTSSTSSSSSSTQIIKSNQKSYYKNGEFIDGCITSNGDMAVMVKK